MFTDRCLTCDLVVLVDLAPFALKSGRADADDGVVTDMPEIAREWQALFSTNVLLMSERFAALPGSASKTGVKMVGKGGKAGKPKRGDINIAGCVAVVENDGRVSGQSHKV